MAEAKWSVTYQVKFSEQWCADECGWVEHQELVTAPDAVAARRCARKLLDAMLRVIRGRHISTREIRRTGRE